jgi:hypothetical protein
VGGTAPIFSDSDPHGVVLTAMAHDQEEKKKWEKASTVSSHVQTRLVSRCSSWFGVNDA